MLNYQSNSNGNAIIFKTLGLLQELSTSLGYSGEKNREFYKRAKYLQHIQQLNYPLIQECENKAVDEKTESSVAQTSYFRNCLCSLLCEAEIPLLNEYVYKLKHPGITLENVNPNEIEKMSLFDLSDVELVNYFGLFCRTVTYIENDGLLLLKYNQVIYETGWSKYALMCRGKVVDIDSGTIISYPFDKFFNLNEVPETKEARIVDLMNSAKDIYVSEKMDGTLIAVSTWENTPLVTTTGAFDNEYISLAKSLFQANYQQFYDHVPSGYTFIFELIAPISKQCVDYGDDKKLFLIGVRDIDSAQLLPRPQMMKMATAMHLDLVEEDNLSLAEMLRRTKDRNVNKEGWVIRIRQEDDTDFIVKLKYDEYFFLHRMKSGVNVRKIYNLYVFENINEQLNRMVPGSKEAALSVIEEININRVKISERAIQVAVDCCRSLGINVQADLSRSELKSVSEHLSYLEGKDKPFCFYALRYIRYKNLKYSFKYLSFDKYQKLVDALVD